jgi:hypothetical protein
LEGKAFGPARALIERLVFNAPSYLRAAAFITSSTLQGRISGQIARRSLVRLGSAMALGMYGLYKGSDMDEREIMERFDPGSNKFMKYPWKLPNGDVLEIGLTSPMLGVIRLLGDTYDIATGQDTWGVGTKGDPFVRYMAHRGAPLVKLREQFNTGEDFLGRPITKLEATGRAVVPMSGESLIGKEKMGTKIIDALATASGLSSRSESYGEQKKRLMDEGLKSKGKTLETANVRERTVASKNTKAPLEASHGKQTLDEENRSAKVALDKQAERKKSLEKALPQYVHVFMDEHKLRLPGFNIPKEQQVTIPLTKEEEKSYINSIAQEYMKAIDRIDKESFRLKSPEIRQAIFDQHTKRARAIARQKLERAINQSSQ